jgi:hypothetical protein
MKTLVVLAVSIVLVGIFFCPVVMSAPSMPTDVQMVQPDPSLPTELAAFWGKWEFTSASYNLFLIVEKIDEEKASLYVWREGYASPEGGPLNWRREEAKVFKERGKYKVWYTGPYAKIEYTLKGEYLVGSTQYGSSNYRRVP